MSNHSSKVLDALMEEKVTCSSCISDKEFDLFLPIRCIFAFERLDLVIEVTDEDEVTLRVIGSDKRHQVEDSMRFRILKYDLGYLSEYWILKDSMGFRDGFQFEFTSTEGVITRVQAIATASMLEIVVFDLEGGARPYFPIKRKWHNSQ